MVNLLGLGTQPLRFVNKRRLIVFFRLKTKQLFRVYGLGFRADGS